MSSFSSNQIVWAKVKGYPWWPAMIIKVQSIRGRNSPKEILVNFIGDNSHAAVGEDKIADFDEKFKQFSVVKNKKLQDGIKAAQRIQKGESTFEEERVKFESKKRRPSFTSESVESMFEDRSFEDEMKFQSPKASKGKKVQESGSKQKEKEKKEEKIEEPHMTCDSFLDFIPNRVTRAQSKDQHIEVRAEPFLFLAKKPTIHGRGKKKAESVSEMQEESESHSAKRKASTEISVSEQHPNEHLENETVLLSPKLNESSPSNTMKTAASDGSQSEMSKKQDGGKKVVVSKENSRKRIVLEKEHEESSEEKMYNEDSQERANHSSSPKIKAATSAVDDILKTHPRKINFSGETMRKELEGGSLAQFENDFEYYLNKFINKFKQKDILDGNDQDIEELLGTIEEFKKIELQGASLIDSKVGKILKTMDYVFSKNRQKMNGKDSCITNELGNIIKKIKENILKFCLDNTRYVETLKLNTETDDRDTKETTRMEIETVEISHQQIDNNTPKFTKNSLFIDTLSPVTTKIDDTPRSLKDFTSPNLASLFANLKDMPNFSLNSVRKSSGDSMMSKTEQQADRGLRKKVCARIIRAMQDNYKMEKEKAQEIILKVEGKIHEANSHSFDSYKQAMMNFYKLIKTHDLNLNDVNEIKEMNAVVFHNLLEHSAISHFSLLGNKGISAEVLESPSLKNLRLDLNLMEKFDHVSNEHRKEGLTSFVSLKQQNQSPLKRAKK